MKKNLNILITGCSSGFGRVTAETLAMDGHNVFATMRDIKGKNATAKEGLETWAKERAVSLKVVEIDITDERSVEMGVDSITNIAGSIDVAVNNAGIASVGIQEAFTPTQVKQIFDVNTFGPLTVNRAVLPYMRKQKSGLLIHITSVIGRLYFPFMGVYCASKFAMEALAEAYRCEVAPYNIDSIIIEPGVYPTSIQANMVPPADSTRLTEYGDIAKIPEKIFGGLEEMLSGDSAPDPQEVADAVKKLIDTPAGERPVRTVVGLFGTEGINELNSAVEKYQKGLLQSVGLEQ